MSWLKRKLAILYMAFANVEKNAFNNMGNTLDTDINKHQRLTQGRLSDALLNGEVTEEVKELKWRMYKILDHSDGLTANVTGYDEDGLPIVSTTRSFNKIKKLKVDEFDSFPPIMVINNEPNITSLTDMMNTMDIHEDNTEIPNEVITTQNEVEYPIEIERDDITALEIEKYSKKLIIREMGDDEFLLEFYVPKYSDEFNKKSSFVLAEIKKLIANPRFSSLTNIRKVRFLTNKSIGIKDNLFFEYDIKSLHNIVEFNGNYVIKFKSKVIINGNNILLIHKHDELDEKYNNKEKK